MRSPERQHREWGSLSWRSMAAMVVISGIFNFLVYADYTGNYPSSSSAAAWHVIKSAHPLPATELTECMSTWVEGWLNAKHKLSLSFPPPAPLSHWKLHVHSSALEKYEISSNACRSLMVKWSIWFRSQSIKHSLTLQPLISNVDDPVCSLPKRIRPDLNRWQTDIYWLGGCMSLSVCPALSSDVICRWTRADSSAPPAAGIHLNEHKNPLAVLFNTAKYSRKVKWVWKLCKIHKNGINLMDWGTFH